MTPSNRHECPDCETVFIGTPKCPGCGWSPTGAKSHVGQVAETHRAWSPPAEIAEAPREFVKAELAKVYKLLGVTRDVERPPASGSVRQRLGLPDVHPEIRANPQVGLVPRDRTQAEPVGALLESVVPGLKSRR